jgi:hypothetical protein
MEALPPDPRGARESVPSTSPAAPTAGSTPSVPSPVPSRASRRLSRTGAWLIALGIAGILWGVFHVLGPIGDLQASRPGQRTSYNENKVVVHRHFAGGLLRALAGLGVAMLGGELRYRARRREEEGGSGE